MTQREALLALGMSTREAAVEVLRTFAGDNVEVGDVHLEQPGIDPVEGVDVPATMASVSYTGGATGGNLIVADVVAARRLASAMMGLDPYAPLEPGEPSELELSAFGEAMNQVMAAAASATALTLGDEVDISIPSVSIASSRRQLVVGFQGAANVAVCDLTLFGRPCRLVQFIPQQFALLMTRALSLTTRPEPVSREDAREVMEAVVRAVPLRFSVELGRRRVFAGDASGLQDGATIDLDRRVDDPVDVYVAGSRYARGRLVVENGDEWAVRLEQIFPQAQPMPTTTEKGVS